MRKLSSVLLFAGISFACFAQTPAKPAPAPAKPAPAPSSAAPAKNTQPAGGKDTVKYVGTAPGRHHQVKPNQTNLDLTVHFGQLKSGEVLLAHHWVNSNRVVDTGYIDAKGTVRFQADSAVPGGIYLVVLPSKRPFEIILAEEQKFSIDIPDTNKILETIKITGSKENVKFYEHQSYMNSLGMKVEPYKAGVERGKKSGNKDSVAYYTKKINETDSLVRKYKEDYIKNNPDLFMTKVLKLMDEPKAIPLEQCPRKADGTIDSAYNYRNYRAHYWDGMDFTDERMLNTPGIFYNKMKFWVEKVIPQHPDTLAKDICWFLDQCYQNDEIYQYTVGYLTYHFESSKIMGFDAVFVAIVLNNHAKNRCWWLTVEQNQKIVKRAQQLQYTLLEHQAVNLFMLDSAGRTVELGKIQADYTIVVFWDPECGHCKTEIPQLKLYYDSLKAAGHSVEVYAIYSEFDPLNQNVTWKKYIREHKHTWKDVHARTAMDLATAKFYYDVYATPTLYVLDKNKKIIAKRLDPHGLRTVLDRRIEMDKKAAGKQ